MTAKRIGVLFVLLAISACAPKTERPVVSSYWANQKEQSAQRDLASAKQVARVVEQSAFQHRMIVRDPETARPLSVSFVGPQNFLPRNAAEPRIVPTASPLQCVPFARDLSGIQIRGNAWTWWGKAEGLYRRTDRPQVGSVMVLSRTGQLRLGHLAVVTEILSDREIVVSHANWLNKGNIHLDTPVIDVSPNNDWSRIRSWYVPGQTMGLNVYAVSGFILPQPVQSADSRAAN